MTLRADDLKNLVKKVFEIDAYKSKIGDDNEIVVLSFTVLYEEPAKDLENFIEMGYNFVLDADVTNGETEDGHYKVFVELERNRQTAERIYEILAGIERLTGMPDMRFRYFKNFKSYDATVENLSQHVPINKRDYEAATDSDNNDNYTTFFEHSFANNIKLDNDTIIFERAYKKPVSLTIVDSGPKASMYQNNPGPLMLESASAVLNLTAHIGNYNISKIKDNYIFEKDNWAVVLR